MGLKASTDSTDQHEDSDTSDQNQHKRHRSRELSAVELRIKPLKTVETSPAVLGGDIDFGQGRCMTDTRRTHAQIRQGVSECESISLSLSLSLRNSTTCCKVRTIMTSDLQRWDTFRNVRWNIRVQVNCEGMLRYHDTLGTILSVPDGSSQTIGRCQLQCNGEVRKRKFFRKDGSSDH